MVEKSLQCTSCDHRFYQTPDFECKPCTQLCEECVGPNLEHCSALSAGYFFDRNKQKIDRCPDGCATCDEQGNCIRCRPNYRAETISTDDGKKKTRFDQVLVNCLRCKDSNCMFCDYEKSVGYEICTQCQVGFGPHPYNKNCYPCPEGCLTCASNNLICSYCKEGLQINPKTGMCDKIEDPNCGSFDVENGVCNWCQKGFGVDPTNNKTCASCTIIDPLCSSCVAFAPLEKTPNPNPKNLKCWTCAPGFTLNPSTGKCVACADNCSFCSHIGKCFTCKAGYHLAADGTCATNMLPNCEYINVNGECISCKLGFYLVHSSNGSTTCDRCDAACNACADKGPQECTQCAVTKVSIKDDTSQNLNPYIYQSIHGCADTCPRKSAKGKSLQIDEFHRICVYNNEWNPNTEPVKPAARYEFGRRRDIKDKEALHLDSVEFIINMTKYASESIASSALWAKEYPEPAKAFAKQCNHRGKLIEKLNFDRETYFECICNKGYHGLTCEIDEDLYNSVQGFMIRFIKDIEANLDQLSFIDFYQIYKNLNFGPMNYNTLIHMTNLIYHFHQNRLFESKQPMDFLVTVDNMLKSHYRQHLEIQRDLDNKRLDIDHAYIKVSVFQRLHYIIGMAENVMARSLNYTSNFEMTATNAFQCIYNSPVPGDFKPTSAKTLRVFPSDMLNLGNNRNPLEFSISSTKLDKKAKSVELVAWVWSSMLFSLSKYSGNLATFVFSINIIAKSNLTSYEQLKDDGDVITARFPLKIVPANHEFQKTLRCIELEYKSDHTVHDIKETFIHSVGKFALTNEPFVVCKFSKPKIDDVFFTVGYTGEKKNTQTLGVVKDAMDEADDFRLDTAPMPELFKAASLSAAAVFFGVLIWLSAAI